MVEIVYSKMARNDVKNDKRAWWTQCCCRFSIYCFNSRFLLIFDRERFA